jgi:hypothetical protein
MPLHCGISILPLSAIKRTSGKAVGRVGVTRLSYKHMQCSKRPVNLGAFGQALGLLTNYNLAPADEKDPRMTALRRRGKLCYGSFLKIHPRFQSAAALRAADTGDDDD